MGQIGVPELLIICGVIVLFFGGKKLPALGGAIGESIKNFKRGLKENDDVKSTEEKNTIRNDIPPG